jgi:hypothetical protein
MEFRKIVILGLYILTMLCSKQNNSDKQDNHPVFFNNFQYFRENHASIGFSKCSDEHDTAFSNYFPFNTYGKSRTFKYNLISLDSFFYYIQSFYISEAINDTVRIELFRQCHRSDTSTNPFRSSPMEKITDLHIKTWMVGFFNRDTLYTVVTRGQEAQYLKSFSLQFKKLVSADNADSAVAALNSIRKEISTFFIKREVQNCFKNRNYYSGKIIRFPTDTLSSADEGLFKTVIKNFRKQNNIDTNNLIDTLLLNLLNIPLDPIAEGLKIYEKYADKKLR